METRRNATATERFLAKLEADIRAFLERHQMTESRFGREVANNTELLPRLRRRQTSANTLIKISQYLRDHRK
jgi:hypothetical protein